MRRAFKTGVGRLLLITALWGCRSVPRVEVPQEELARRLVLALDGVDYRDVVSARERGLFESFEAPSRLISTFPSISDVAWHDIFGVLPPAGYQRVYYSRRQNATVGEALDAITPIEYEQRMDRAFGERLHHLSAYLASNTVAKREVDVDVKEFMRIRGRPTVYMYNVGPDALQHTRGDLDAYLGHLDERLTALQSDYRKRTGRSLEIVLLSDHGHNRAVGATFVAVVQELRDKGFRAARSLVSPSDVAFSVDGVTTGFGVFAHADSVSRVADIMAAIPGVELVSSHEANGFRVQSGNAIAFVTVRRTAAGAMYGYRREKGDPLRYADIMQRMQRDGVIDEAGEAPDSMWLRYTAAAHFPAALARIVRGHTDITLNPAPILVSLSDSVKVGLGMVSVANRMRPLGGTHGALSASNSLGVLMTNFMTTRDDVTENVRKQLGDFADLRDVTSAGSLLRIVDRDMLARDRWSRMTSVQVPAESDSAPLLLLALSDADRAWVGSNAYVSVELRLAPSGGAKGELVSFSQEPLAEWTRSADGRRYARALSALRVRNVPPSTDLEIQVVFDRIREDGATLRAQDSRTVRALLLRSDAAGRIWSH